MKIKGWEWDPTSRESEAVMMHGGPISPMALAEASHRYPTSDSLTSRSTPTCPAPKLTPLPTPKTVCNHGQDMYTTSCEQTAGKALVFCQACAAHRG